MLFKTVHFFPANRLSLYILYSLWDRWITESHVLTWLTPYMLILLRCQRVHDIHKCATCMYASCVYKLSKLFFPFFSILWKLVERHVVRIYTLACLLRLRSIVICSNAQSFHSLMLVYMGGYLCFCCFGCPHALHVSQRSR